jgi:HEAT repeat protein
MIETPRRRLSSAVLRVVVVAALTATASASDDQSPTWQDVMRNLQDRRADARLKAVESLNVAGYGAAADAVAPLIADPDPKVRYAAIDAELTFFLNESVDAAATDGKSPKHSRAQDAFDAGPLVRNAGVAPSSVIDALVHALKDDAPRIRFDALHAIGVIAEPPLGQDAAEALAAGLDAADPTTRIATARVLGRLRVTSAGAKLIAALNDKNTLEQKYATEALGLIKDQRAVASLLERFDFYKTGDLAVETLLALARIGHASARETLRAHLNDKDEEMRVAAVEGLGRLHDADSRDAIVARLQKDPSPSVRLAATYAIGCLGDPDVPTLARGLASTDTYGQAVDDLLELGPAAVSGVETAIGAARENGLRADLIHVLGFVGKRDAVPVIEPFLKDHNDRVAHAAVDAVARLSR